MNKPDLSRHILPKPKKTLRWIPDKGFFYVEKRAFNGNIPVMIGPFLTIERAYHYPHLPTGVVNTPNLR